ncbi:MAG: hypothetical protein R6U96_17415 [Promethearchaeia archaeon]
MDHSFFLAAVDLMSLFTGKALITTFGEILTAFLGGVGGGIMGGTVSSSSEVYL